MKLVGVTVAAAALLTSAGAVQLQSEQPIYSPEEGRDYYGDSKFATSAADTKDARPPGFRSAWDDCGGVGASATERMRTIAATIKGWAKPLPFVRNAAQDCGEVNAFKPGPGSQVNYPGPEITAAAAAGLAKADETLATYPAGR
mmetsp:Transcript_27506/g.64149  ORF Transcript_27506/g.64149 Transcript_27506/m.64149 type:complete len:144 (-) Transcript_27506:171-602(-)|eukprot:CAMPEP_0178414650 /NCGR_PEP_ID=MMETSP0689_2-20121128/23145_1 /TAXON_ID=160604 /ORGANISM="Amphidinium massartii, Strain CS-259" /LENGTH=143 /DNA_ID=CAMNT_0020035945 /DNA_START=69 /DNA_END=500 /DNA_ORIENTATION=-